MSDNQVSLEENKECCSNIIFSIDGKNLITFNEKGIKLHRENFPDFTLDDFAEKFIKNMEDRFDIRFIPVDKSSAFEIKWDSSVTKF